MGYYGEQVAMSNSCTIRIERLANGWTVRMTDPKIVEANNKRSEKSNYSTPWKDPEVTFAFDDSKGVMKFLQANLEKALPVDEYDTSFAKALGETAEDKD